MKDEKGKFTTTDAQRIHLVGRRFFTSKPVKNTDLVSFKAAKAFAYHVLYTHLKNYPEIP